MKAELRRFGNGRHPVVVIDDFSGEIQRILGLAEAMAPFPRLKRNFYPGVRRVITRADPDADAYVQRTCEAAAQYIAGAFDIERFELIEASFSVVTTAPAGLSPPQRAPHFDTTDPEHLALLHYLHVPEGSGTAFYRQRSTGVERVTDANVGCFVTTATREAALLPPGSGYIRGSDSFYEQIGAVEAVPDRLLIYQGSLLHSGIIPEHMCFSADPRRGRLTANLFVRGN